jgi:hypothetical protein
MLSEPLSVTLAVVRVLEALEAPYLVGGSIASSLYGVVRATLDTDLVADLDMHHVRPLADLLRVDFYLSQEAIEQAVSLRTHFSVIHLEAIYKVDVFVSLRRPFEQVRFQRRLLQTVSTEPECRMYVSTVEDTVLAKLEWYRRGGQVSERQWRDVLGMLKVQRDCLDGEHLRRWASALQVRDLLEKAFEESGLND